MILLSRNEFAWGVCYAKGNVILFPPDYKVSDKDGEHSVGCWRIQTSEHGQHSNSDFEEQGDALKFLAQYWGDDVILETKEERRRQRNDRLGAKINEQD